MPGTEGTAVEETGEVRTLDGRVTLAALLGETGAAGEATVAPKGAGRGASRFPVLRAFAPNGDGAPGVFGILEFWPGRSGYKPFPVDISEEFMPAPPIGLGRELDVALPVPFEPDALFPA